MIKMKWHIMWRWIISNFLFYLTPFLGISRIYVTVYFQFSELNVKMRKGAKKKTIYFADLESHLEPNIEAIIWLQIRNQLLRPQLRDNSNSISIILKHSARSETTQRKGKCWVHRGLVGINFCFVELERK